MTVNTERTTTTVVAMLVAVAILVAVMCFTSMSDTETKTAVAASIGGFSMIPTDSDNIVTSDGAISIFAPTGVPGHWETEGEFFSGDSDVFFCPGLMKDGTTREYTFIPDDPALPESTVRATMRGFAG